VVVAGEVELQEGQPVLRVAHLGCLYLRSDQVDGVQSPSPGALLGCGSRRRQAPATASGACSSGRSSCLLGFFVFHAARSLTTSTRMTLSRWRRAASMAFGAVPGSITR